MTTEKQTQGTVKFLKHESDILKNNPPGDNYVRDLIVYLPPGYEDSGEKYPVVYNLIGFTGRGKMFLNDSAFSPNLAERMDKLIADGKIKPMIAVLPDCFTHYGGSQYINSSATGRYEDYLIEEIVPVLNPPQALILGVGAGIRQPWDVGGQIALATIMSATGSFDHRAIDGAVAARFMVAFKEVVQSPLVLCA